MQSFFTSQNARELINTYDFAIFPLHGVIDGACTCGDPDCRNVGKHPATLAGFKDASKDIETVKALWAGRHGLNVGIATGAASGIFVIDIDGPEGAESISHMIEEYGPLPITLTSKTARGRHLIFKHPGAPIRSRGNMLPKVDVRGDGGYIVGPYSNHLSGAKYEFINPLEEIAPAPQWLLDLVMNDRPRPTGDALLPEYQPRKGLLTLSDRWSEDDIRKLLGFIHPDLDYHDWFQIGMAIKDYGLPFDVWNDWSRGGSKYDPSIMLGKWNSFKNSGVTIGTIVYLAKQGGWKPDERPYIDRAAILNAAPAARKDEPAHDPETGEIIETLPPTTEPIKTPSGLFYVKAGDITANVDSSDFVQGLLSDSALSVVYGESNCGKTFFMTDLCFMWRWASRGAINGSRKAA